MQKNKRSETRPVGHNVHTKIDVYRKGDTQRRGQDKNDRDDTTDQRKMWGRQQCCEGKMKKSHRLSDTYVVWSNGSTNKQTNGN